jgi:hypothetical protein
MRTSIVLIIPSILAAACGGSASSPEVDGICDVHRDCGEFTDSEADGCKDDFALVEADRALADCAACYARQDCEGVEACGLACGPAREALATALTGVRGEREIQDLDPDDAGALCAWSLDRWGGPGEIDCGGEGVVIPGQSECEATLVNPTGQYCNMFYNVADFVWCIEITRGDPCRLSLEESYCSSVRNCLQQR